MWIYTDERPHWRRRKMCKLHRFWSLNIEEHGYETFIDWLEDMLRFDLIRR